MPDDTATVAPVIIATDKTQLTQFSGNKAAYPVYLTIGNLPKAIRRKPSKNSCILIAYLSVEKLERSKMSDLEHRSRVQRIFHESMKLVLEPLKEAGDKGEMMKSANGDVRQVHPILSCYVADYPEQCLVTCTKYGTCARCQQNAQNLQDFEDIVDRTNDWTESIILNAKRQSKGSLKAFHDACMKEDVAGGTFEPFWKGFPHTDIHKIITPDILHQLYQGVFKHLVGWCQTILGAKELDQRIRALPLAHGLRHFKNGISKLSQVSGSERKNMAKILLGCIQDIMAPEGVKAVKALLDFVFLAQYSTHDNITLSYLQDALRDFHAHKAVFINLGVRKDFNIPKLHVLIHYAECIQLFGTTDNYNTEMFERLHIDFAKHGWRASNQRDEFPQMINWLSRQEKINDFNYLLSVRQQRDSALPLPTPSLSKRLPIRIAKNPQYPNQPISAIEATHNAPGFGRHLKEYLNTLLPHPVGVRTLDATPLPFSTLNIYTNFHFQPEALQDDEEENDVVKALPVSSSLPHGRFDTVIFMDGDDAESTGLAGE